MLPALIQFGLDFRNLLLRNRDDVGRYVEIRHIAFRL